MKNTFKKAALAIAILSITVPAHARTVLSASPRNGREVQFEVPDVIQKGSIVLASADVVQVETEERSTKCSDFFGIPAAGTVYYSGPIVERRTVGAGVPGPWQRVSGKCSRRVEESNTFSGFCGAPPLGHLAPMRGDITTKRIYTVEEDGAISTDTGATQQSNTCQVWMLAAVPKVDSSACTNGTGGFVVQMQWHELWSDGSERNFSPKFEVANPCSDIPVMKIIQRPAACIPGFEGTAVEQQMTLQFGNGTVIPVSPWTPSPTPGANNCYQKITFTPGYQCPSGMRSFDPVTMHENIEIREANQIIDTSFQVVFSSKERVIKPCIAPTLQSYSIENFWNFDYECPDHHYCRQLKYLARWIDNRCREIRQIQGGKAILPPRNGQWARE